MIVTCLRSNDYRWKDKYFFVKGELVCGLRGLGDAPCYWKATSKCDFCLSFLCLTDTNHLSCEDHDFNWAMPNGLIA